MTDQEKHMIKTEFNGFKPQPGFRGGCKKSESVPRVCVHFNHLGKVVSFLRVCKDYSGCEDGEQFSYNP